MKKFIISLLVTIFALTTFTLPANAAYRSYYYEQPYYDSVNRVWVQPYTWSEYEPFYYRTAGDDTYDNNYRYYNSRNYRTASEELDSVTDLDGNEISGFEYRYYGDTSRYTTSQKITATVEIRNDRFSPSVITIRKNDSIKWINRDSDRHAIIGDKTSYGITGSTLNKNASYTKTFSKTGIYYYHDKYDSAIKGKIIVK